MQYPRPYATALLANKIVKLLLDAILLASFVEHDPIKHLRTHASYRISYHATRLHSIPLNDERKTFASKKKKKYYYVYA